MAFIDLIGKRERREKNKGGIFFGIDLFCLLVLVIKKRKGVCLKSKEEEKITIENLRCEKVNGLYCYFFWLVGW